MADTKISALDATNREALRKQTLQNRGCLIGLSANLTAVNASSGYDIPFDAESYDTDSIHDNVTNNTRMTVPSGWTLVRVGGKVFAQDVAVSSGAQFSIRHFNSAGVEQSRRGLPVQEFGTAGYAEYAGSGSSAPIQVVAGDYFQIRIFCSDASITINSSHTSAWMELLA